MSKTHRIRKLIFGKEQDELGQHARDMQSILDRVPFQEHRTIEHIYQEPMVVGNLDQEPFSIELVRIVDLMQPHVPVSACFGFLHFQWLPSQGGAVIQKIGGLDPTTNGTTRFRFYYRVTYRMN
jgi:hypothetical protein